MKLEVLAKQYWRDAAENYERGRVNDKWRTEQTVVTDMLSLLKPGSTVLDIPVGTGRFVPVYATLGLVAVGFDISDDMLAQAAQKRSSSSQKLTLRVSDIRKIDADDATFDCVVCMRFMNWVDPRDVPGIIGELSRVTRGRIIVGVRHFIPFGEIRPFGGLSNMARLLRQLKCRIVGQYGLTFHEKALVERTFADLKLHIRRAEVAEARRDGTEYVIYLLEKSD